MSKSLAPRFPLRILETCLYVDDLSAAKSFYQQTLGLSFYSEQEGRHVFFRCGQQMLLLFDRSVTASEKSDLPPHGAAGPGHLAFDVSEEGLDVWRERLRDAGVEIEQIVDWGPAVSYYFRDPAGNSLEITCRAIWSID